MLCRVGERQVKFLLKKSFLCVISKLLVSFSKGCFMVKERKSIIDVQWITVSYRSAIIFVTVLLLVVAGLSYKYLYLTPQTLAKNEISRAEKKLAEAQPFISGPQVKSEFTEAALKLQEARNFYEKRSFPEAGKSAGQSYAISMKIIDSYSGDGAGNIRITRVEGTVKVKRAGTFTWVEAREDMVLSEGDKIKAHNGGSARFVSFTGDIATIKPGVLCEIKKSVKDQKTDDEKIEIFVNEGFLDLRSTTKKTTNSHFKVITPTSEVKVKKKAYLSIGASESETSIKVATSDVGAVTVSSGNREIEIEANEAVKTTKAGIGKKFDLPDPPVLISPAASYPFFFDDIKEGIVTLKWEISPDADSYHLLVSNSRLFATSKVDQDVDSSQVKKGVSLKGLPKGSYFWKVSLKDKRGYVSRYSEVRMFRISSSSPPASGTPPKLEVLETTPIGRYLIIKGISEPGIYLTMNGQRVDVYEDGTFNNIYKLEKLGKNEIEIIAQDNYGLSSREVVTTIFKQ